LHKHSRRKTLTKPKIGLASIILNSYSPSTRQKHFVATVTKCLFWRTWGGAPVRSKNGDPRTMRLSKYQLFLIVVKLHSTKRVSWKTFY